MTNQPFSRWERVLDWLYATAIVGLDGRMPVAPRPSEVARQIRVATISMLLVSSALIASRIDPPQTELLREIDLALKIRYEWNEAAREYLKVVSEDYKEAGAANSYLSPMRVTTDGQVLGHVGQLHLVGKSVLDDGKNYSGALIAYRSFGGGFSGVLSGPRTVHQFGTFYERLDELKPVLSRLQASKAYRLLLGSPADEHPSAEPLRIQFDSPGTPAELQSWFSSRTCADYGFERLQRIAEPGEMLLQCLQGPDSIIVLALRLEEPVRPARSFQQYLAGTLGMGPSGLGSYPDTFSGAFPFAANLGNEHRETSFESLRTFAQQLADVEEKTVEVAGIAMPKGALSMVGLSALLLLEAYVFVQLRMLALVLPFWSSGEAISWAGLYPGWCAGILSAISIFAIPLSAVLVTPGALVLRVLTGSCAATALIFLCVARRQARLQPRRSLVWRDVC